MSASIKAQALALSAQIRDEFRKLSRAYPDVGDDVDDTCDRVVSLVLERMAAISVDQALESDQEATFDALQALEDDPTGQDDPDPATRRGCGADDTFDKSGARRLSRFNDAGEARW